MTCTTTAYPSCGNVSTNSQIDIEALKADARRSKMTSPIASNPLERLAQLVASNDRLMDELVTSRARIVAARSYLDRPGCNDQFGSAHLERCRTKHSGILAQLRANRIEALQLLGKGGSDD